MKKAVDCFARTSWVFGVLMALLATAEARGDGKYTTPDNETLMAESNYMAQLFKRTVGKTGAPWMKIDFADPAQHRFVVNRLLASGNTPDNSPYLFSRVETMRQKALARAKGDITISSNTKKCGHLLDVQKANSSYTANVHSNPQVSCFSGADYTFADIYAYRMTEAGFNRTLLASNSGEEYGGGRNFIDVGVDVSIQLDAGYKLSLDSMVMSMDDSGEEFTSFSIADTVIVTTNFVYTITHPQERLNMVPEVTIRSCLERGAVYGNLDCDYASVYRNPITGTLTPYAAANGAAPTGVAAVKLPVVNNTWQADPALYWEPTTDTGTATTYDMNKLYLPLLGKLKATDSNCKISDFKNNTYAALVIKQAGGTCVQYAVNEEIKAGNFRAALLAGLNGTPANEIPYSVLGNFGPDCLAYLRDAAGLEWQDVELKFFIMTEVRCAPNNTPKTLIAQTRTGLWLDFKNSCIAEGTRVLKADGSEAPIESIQVGDKVMANAGGLALTVTTVSRGRESKKMVRLLDEAGHQVLLTSKHPLVTAKGEVLAAEQVKAGMQVLSKSGKTTLTSVEQVDYQGQVYNLALGTKDELAKLSDKDRTLFANGFAVGDSQMQSDLEVKLSAKPAKGDILARLPKALHQDYKNDLARPQTMKKSQ